MELLFSLLLKIHIFCGFFSLILFWIPVFARKGGKLHNSVGRWYVRFMWIVVISAAILSIKNVISDNYDIAAFLGFLSVLTANPLWYAIAILKHKKTHSPALKQMHLRMNVSVFLFGLLLILYGTFSTGSGMSILMLIFGILGISNGLTIWKLYQGTHESRPWIVEHLAGMLVSGIAAYTAFFAFGGRAFFAELLSGYWMILPWVLPTILGVGAIQVLSRRYAPK